MFTRAQGAVPGQQLGTRRPSHLGLKRPHKRALIHATTNVRRHRFHLATTDHPRGSAKGAVRRVPDPIDCAFSGRDPVRWRSEAP
jgi:hypothetical protein